MGRPALALLATRTFSPKDIPGLLLQLSAQASPLWTTSARTTPALADGDPVGGWDDISGNGRIFTQATAGQRGTLKLAVADGKRAVRFVAASTQALICTTEFLNVANFTFVAVFKHTAAASAEVYLDQGPTGAAAQLAGIIGNSNNTDRCLFRDSANNSISIVPSLFSDANYHVCIAKLDGTTGTLYSNGGKKTVSTNASYTPATFEAAPLPAVGGGAGSYLDGDVCEVLVYNRPLEDFERVQVERYLGSTWGFRTT